MKKSVFKNSTGPIHLLGMAFCLVLTLCCTACSDDEIIAEVEIPKESGLQSVLECSGQTIEISIKSDSEWEVLYDFNAEDIAYAYPEKGSGDAKINLYVMENTDDLRRSGVVTIHFPKDSKRDKQITLEQKSRAESGENFDDDYLGSQSYGLGYGFYGGNGMEPSKSVKKRIIKAEVLQEKGQVSKKAGGKFQLTAHTFTGSTISELSNDFSTSAEFEGGACGFNAEINASFNMKDFSNEQYEYAMTYIDVEEESITITSASDEWLEEDMIVASAYRAINDDYSDCKVKLEDYHSTDEGFRNLVKKYGTHVIASATLGGRLRSSTTIDVSKVTKEYDLDAFAKMSYSGIVDASASVEDSYKNSYEQNKSACSTTVTAWGGSRSLATDVAFARGDEEINNAVKAWINDLNDNEPSWEYIGPADKLDLIPIWELCVDDERKKALQQFIEEKRYLDNTTSYDLGVIGHLNDVDGIAEEMNDPDYKGTLIRDINIGEEGNKTIAKLCSEFIPELNKKGRVLVFYPVLNGAVKWNLGYFPGNEYLKPARISNYGGEIKVVTRTNDEIGCPREIYLRGASITAKEIDGETEVVEASANDFFLRTYKIDDSERGGDKEPGDRLGDYPVVKVFNNIWMRENFSGSRSGGDNQYLNSITPYPTYYHPAGDNMLYMVYFALNYKLMAPPNWSLIKNSDMEHIMEGLNKYEIDKTAAFLDGGVLGTDILLNGAAFGYNTMSSWVFSYNNEGTAGYLMVSDPSLGTAGRPGYRFDNEGFTYRNFYLSSYEFFFSMRFVQPIE
ncbi:MAG: MAC/perforin domain-containing protein [Bacteroides sp.]